MLTTIAVLVIVLGLMVSLARRVRQGSAESVTVDLLRNLDVLTEQYKQRNHGQLPQVVPFVTEADVDPDEATLQKRALANNRDLVRVLKGQVDLSAGAFAKLPVSIYDEATLRDAWGTPIVFLPRYHRAIGMPPGGEYFFVSAGPDRKFRTRADNLYSYETPGGGGGGGSATAGAPRTPAAGEGPTADERK
jgi:hypothetical protein